MVELSGKKVTVMGLGQFGGGAGAVRFLVEQGALVTLTDLRTSSQLAESLAEIELDRLHQLVLGEHREADFLEADLVVVNPAVVRQGNHFLELASKAGVELTSEMNLFWQNCRARKIVVTGSTGKSTTATLIANFLQAAGVPCHLGGNIGISLLPGISSLTEDDYAVLELSSFQLAALDPLQPRPDISVLTNFFPNHLDWHGSLEHYRSAKQTAIAYQTPEQLAVLNGDDDDSALWPTDAHVIWYGHEVWQDRPGVHIGPQGIAVRSAVGGWMIHPEDLAESLRTPHGMQNVAAALATVVVGLKVPVDRIASALLEFRPLPHRLEEVGEFQGRRFLNDSKATTPEATIAALNAISSPVLLIAGGKDKGVSLEHLADVIRSKVKRVIFIGDTADTLTNLVNSASAQTSLPSDFITKAEHLADAFERAWNFSAPGDVILLSPACASHAEFMNYEKRGEKFREAFQRLSSGTD